MAKERVLLTGASGLIGTSLLAKLRERSVETIRLVRRPVTPGRGEVFWNPYSAAQIGDPIALASLEGISAAIHLSGANLAGHRWTKRYQAVIQQSRQQSTRALSCTLAGLKTKPAVLLAASAVGIYGSRGEELLNESSSLGQDFLAEVCRAWEEATLPAKEAGIRVVHLRFGVVLSRLGGVLPRILPLFRLGLGGRLGSGRQWMSWIALPDALSAIEFALGRKALSGAVNLVAPSPITNREFTCALSQTLHKPALLPIPELALKLTLGEMAEGTLLASQRAIPERLEATGFRFQFPEVRAALQTEAR